MVSNRTFLSYSIVLNSVFYNISYNEGLSICSYRMESLSYVVFTSPISAARFKTFVSVLKQ